MQENKTHRRNSLMYNFLFYGGKKMSKNIKKIAVLTGGGDCPGLNAVIRAVVKTAINQYSLEVVGVEDGFEGLIRQKIRKLNSFDVSGILAVGGTILGTSNKANPFKYWVDGKEIDVSDKLVHYCRDEKIDALVCIGGDGTLTMANQLYTQKGLSVVGVPKTIDNDLSATDRTFGFDSAVSCVSDAIDRIHSTAMSHHRIMIIETMGRYAGWIALHGGMAAGADLILLPEFPYDLEVIHEICHKRNRVGKRFTIIAIAEGARQKDGEMCVQKIVKDSTDPLRLGGISYKLAGDLEKIVNSEVRVTVLGHLQRGGSPTAYDRNLATSFGTKAVHLLMNNEIGTMSALKGNEVIGVSLQDAVGAQKKVTKNDPLLQSAISIGISFGIKADDLAIKNNILIEKSEAKT